MGPKRPRGSSRGAMSRETTVPVGYWGVGVGAQWATPLELEGHVGLSPSNWVLTLWV